MCAAASAATPEESIPPESTTSGVVPPAVRALTARSSVVRTAAVASASDMTRRDSGGAQVREVTAVPVRTSRSRTVPAGTWWTPGTRRTLGASATGRPAGGVSAVDGTRALISVAARTRPGAGSV